MRSEILSFSVPGKPKPELARVLFDTNDNPVQMQFFEEGEGEKYLPGDNREGISKIIYKITDKEYSAAQFHIDGKSAGDTYFRILEKGWEVRRKKRDVYERTDGYERIVYDENCIKAGKKLEECIALKETYGEDGKLKEEEYSSGIVRYVNKYDAKGNLLLKETYGSDEKLRGWIAREVNKYDEKGNQILKETYGEDEKLKGYSDDNGIARYVYKYDEKGNRILKETYGADEKLKGDIRYGIARYVRKYDEKGNEILKETYGADGKLKGGEFSIARYVYKYNENCLKAGKKSDECRTLKETYGEDEKLTVDYNHRIFDNTGVYIDGFASEVSKYDEKGNLILKETYGSDEKLKGDDRGIARYVYKYGDKGNLILTETYRADEELEVNKYDENCLKAGKKSDECITLKETYGEDGKLKGDYAGIARYVKKYDENCLKAGEKSDECITLKETYGADGKPKGDRDDIARYVRKYDEKGNEIQKETYGANGKLIARKVNKYDERGNWILTEIYGEDGKLKGDRYDIARYVNKYDEKGNRILKETYGADGKLEGDRDDNGIARYVYKYDENCLKVEKNGYECLTLKETYGEDGKLKGDRYDIARYVNKYDGKGTYKLSETFGADGKRKERTITRYDIKGYKISTTSFSSSGSYVKTELSPVFHHPSIPDQILQVILDELFRAKEVKIQTSKK